MQTNICLHNYQELVSMLPTTFKRTKTDFMMNEEKLKVQSMSFGSENLSSACNLSVDATQRHLDKIESFLTSVLQVLHEKHYASQALKENIDLLFLTALGSEECDCRPKYLGASKRKARKPELNREVLYELAVPTHPNYIYPPPLCSLLYANRVRKPLRYQILTGDTSEANQVYNVDFYDYYTQQEGSSTFYDSSLAYPAAMSIINQGGVNQPQHSGMYPGARPQHNRTSSSTTNNSSSMMAVSGMGMDMAAGNMNSYQVSANGSQFKTDKTKRSNNSNTAEGNSHKYDPKQLPTTNGISKNKSYLVMDHQNKTVPFNAHNNEPGTLTFIPPPTQATLNPVKREKTSAGKKSILSTLSTGPSRSFVNNNFSNNDNSSSGSIPHFSAAGSSSNQGAGNKRKKEEPTYCICNQVSYGDMIACDDDTCQKEWFHFTCVDLTAKPKGKWYCPACLNKNHTLSLPSETAEIDDAPQEF